MACNTAAQNRIIVLHFLSPGKAGKHRNEVNQYSQLLTRRQHLVYGVITPDLCPPQLLQALQISNLIPLGRRRLQSELLHHAGQLVQQALKPLGRFR